MRRTNGHGPSGGIDAVLSGSGAVIGWSIGTGSEIALVGGLIATSAALIRRRHPKPVPAAQGATMADSQTGWQEVQRELDRSRRHERPFVLIRIPGPASAAGSLKAFLRSADSLWVSGGNVYVLLPESSRARGEAVLARVRDSQPALLPGNEQLVAFPEDGVTRGALVALLHGHAVVRHSLPLDQGPVRVPEMT